MGEGRLGQVVAKGALEKWQVALPDWNAGLDPRSIKVGEVVEVDDGIGVLGSSGP